MKLSHYDLRACTPAPASCVSRKKRIHWQGCTYSTKTGPARPPLEVASRTGPACCGLSSQRLFIFMLTSVCVPNFSLVIPHILTEYYHLTSQAFPCRKHCSQQLAPASPGHGKRLAPGNSWPPVSIAPSNPWKRVPLTKPYCLAEPSYHKRNGSAQRHTLTISSRKPLREEASQR